MVIEWNCGWAQGNLKFCERIAVVVICLLGLARRCTLMDIMMLHVAVICMD